jgi:hypothetical protein
MTWNLKGFHCLIATNKPCLTAFLRAASVAIRRGHVGAAEFIYCDNGATWFEAAAMKIPMCS